MESQIKVELQSWMGSDRMIAESAWTSSTTLQGKQKRTEADVERVVRTLIKEKHATPIESVVFRFWLKLPIQTDRQHMTHRIASQNGMSGRYRTMPAEWLHVTEDISVITAKLQERRMHLPHYENLCQQANDWYQALILDLKEAEKAAEITNKEYKRLREFYRGVLPQNNMTERITILNLRSFSNYQKLRNSEHAQLEIQQLAQLMLEAVENSNACPIAIKSLKEVNWDI